MYKLLFDLESVNDRDRLLNERYVAFMKEHFKDSSYEEDYEKYLAELNAESEKVQ